MLVGVKGGIRLGLLDGDEEFGANVAEFVNIGVARNNWRGSHDKRSNDVKQKGNIPHRSYNSFQNSKLGCLQLSRDI